MPTGIELKRWSWPAAALLGGAATAWSLRPSVEPLTGYGRGFYCFLILLGAALAGFAVHLLFKKWWGILSAFLLLACVMIAWPSPSQPALKLVLVNATSSAVRVTAFRTRYPNRNVSLDLAPRSTRAYYTAAGNYPDSLDISLRAGNRQFSSPVSRLRTGVVVYNADGFQLKTGASRK
jgi:hypothetical protein